MSESDPQKRLLQLTQAIEQNIENKKREPSSIVVRVLFSRLTHYEDKKEIVPRLMSITGVQAEKTAYITKVVCFESSFPLINELRKVETGQCLHLTGFVRQSEDRILLQQSSAFVKVVLSVKCVRVLTITNYQEERVKIIYVGEKNYL